MLAFPCGHQNRAYPSYFKIIGDRIREDYMRFMVNSLFYEIPWDAS